MVRTKEADERAGNATYMTTLSLTHGHWHPKFHNLSFNANIEEYCCRTFHQVIPWTCQARRKV